MPTTDLNPADLAQLVTELVATGVRSVSFDPAEVNTPGVWLRLDGVSFSQLAGLGVKLTAFPVVGDTDPTRAVTELAGLLNQIAPVVLKYGGPTSDVLTTGLLLPGSQKALPALAVPLQLLTTQET